MKILKVRFKNIHSLRGEHEIDFSGGVLAEAGLFVITGPTGSGKSTLLDVITLALYNRIPRIDKIINKTTIEETGVIMTKNTDDCYVEVEYEVKDKKYRSCWSIKRNKNKKLNERKQELIELQTETIIAEKISDVVLKNEEIIGLNYEQFVQSMILAQGQFSKLLLSAKDERNKLLEEITGASIYREIGRRTYRKFTTALKEVNDQKLRMEGIELLDEETIKDFETEKNQRIKQIDLLKNNIQKLSDKINHIESLEKKEQNLKEKEKEWTEYQIEKESSKNDEIKLQAHKKLRHFQTTLDRLENIKTALQDTLNEENEFTSSLKDVDSKLNEVFNTATALLKKNVDKINFGEDLDHFKLKVTTLNENVKEHNTNAKQYVAGILSDKEDLRNFDVEIESHNSADSLKEIELKKASLEKEIASSGFSSPEAVKQAELSIQTTIAKAASLKDKKQLDENVQSIITDLNNEIKLKNTEVKSWNEDLIKIEEALEKINAELPGLEKQVSELKKTKNLEDYRAELQTGEACPLCGSTKHPYAVELKKQNISLLEEQLAQKQLNFNEKNNAKVAVNTKISTTEQFIKDRNEKLENQKEKNKEVLQDINILIQDLQWPENISLVDIKERIEDLEKQQKKLIRIEKYIPAVKKLTELEKKLKAYQSEKDQFENVKAEKNELYPGDDIDKEVSKLTGDFTRFTTSAESLKTSLAKTSQKKENLEKSKKEISEKLLEELKPHQVFSIDDLKNNLLRPEVADSLESNLNKLKEKGISLSTIMESLKREIDEMRAKTELLGNMDELKEERKVKEDEKNNENRLLGIIEERLEENERKKKNFLSAQEVLAKLEAEHALWKKMNQIIGDAEGKKFSNFVQDLTLKQLIHYGNKRLSAFTDRYILDVPMQDESDVLKVVDTYMGNSRRAVSSLSGGETFKISLALAIGLSDLAAKNVRIDSLFIDEGFGSLDPESLDQAISILEQMQNEHNKSIGIISHVNELKERITTRINMKRTGAGYSEIEIE